jgi:hypothetical protein
MTCTWIADLLVGSIGGALSGLAVSIFTRKSDKKELKRVSLEMVKIRLEEYKRNSEAMSIDRILRNVLSDEKTQETIKELQNILVEIKKDLIHCPKAIRDKVLEFSALCKKKDQNLIKAMLERKQNSANTVDIGKEIEIVNNEYSILIGAIEAEIKKIT